MPLSDYLRSAFDALRFPARPEGLYEPISYALDGGGKRLRPTLLLMAYGLYDDHLDTALPAALAIETYHNHTLLHDDLMDHASMRRGRPTVHVKWDANTAILSGDTMLIEAFDFLLQGSWPRKDEMLRLFTRSMREICEGQQYDVNFEQRTDVTEAEYIEMIRLKTSVLLGCAAKLGALAADAPEADADALYRFAEQVGLAFQLQDDYLDVYGDPAVFGKRIGRDIVCGHKTFLLINALQRADAPTRSRLTALLADTAIDEATKIAEVTAIYDSLGIPALTLEAIDSYYAAALRELDALSLPAHKAEPLRQFAGSLLARRK